MLLLAHSLTLLPFISLLLCPLQQQKFQQMSEQIIGRLDEMGKRVEELEKNVGDLVQQVDSKDEPPSAKK